MFEKIISFIITIEVVEIGVEETQQFKFIVYTRHNTPKEQIDCWVFPPSTTMATSCNLHFVTYNMGKKMSLELFLLQCGSNFILITKWLIMTLFVHREEILKEDLHDILKEIEIKNWNGKALEKMTL